MARVLVVEDNASNLTLATFLLESAGHTVLSASDAEAGLALARTENPELILMDIQLPGMDGLEATAHLKADPSTRSIPVIALTALAMKGDEARIRAAGCDAYISKPLNYREFLTTVAGQFEDGRDYQANGDDAPTLQPRPPLPPDEPDRDGTA
jgi:two-component system, cell cycle response regulator DivK